MKMIGKKQGEIKFCLLIFLECHDKKGFPRWNFRKAERVTSSVSDWYLQGTVAAFQMPANLEICAKQLKFNTSDPELLSALPIVTSWSSNLPGWSADNNLAHNPSDQDRVQCTKAGESSLDFFFKIQPVGNIFHSARTGKAWPAFYHCFASIYTLPFYLILILASLW